MSHDDDVDETESIELISTQMLKVMLDTGACSSNELEKAAEQDTDGVLTRNVSGGFEILEKTSLDSLMNEAITPAPQPARKAKTAKPASQQPSAGTGDIRQVNLAVPKDVDELELVDTQMLRVMLDDQRVAEGKQPLYKPEETSGNPYDSLGSALDKSRSDSDSFNPYDSTPKRKP